jgi:hypothetical protein
MSKKKPTPGDRPKKMAGASLLRSFEAGSVIRHFRITAAHGKPYDTQHYKGDETHAEARRTRRKKS